jgi:hypothetical protein
MTPTLKPRARRPRICGAIALVFCAQQLLSAGTFSLPLHSTNGWQFLNYRKIPPNTFRATPAGLEIGVTNSAAPAVFPLTNRLQASQLRVSGNIAGSLQVPPGKQGEKGYDDFIIRVGLVEPGPRTLSWREKIVSADWVKKLFALAPPGTGISRIHFFNVGVDRNQIGHRRAHPLSPLLQETIVAVPDATGHFAFTSHFTPPVKVLAVWIASDGDDTKSSFAVTLDTVEFETLPASVDK